MEEQKSDLKNLGSAEELTRNKDSFGVHVRELVKYILRRVHFELNGKNGLLDLSYETPTGQILKFSVSAENKR